MHVQNKPKICLFFGAAKPRVAKVRKVIYKTTKNSHFLVEETEVTSYISGRYFDHGLISRENDTSKGYFSIPFARLGIFDKYKEVSPSTVPGNTVSRDGDRFSEYDPRSHSRGKRPNSSAVSISTEEIISHNKRVDSSCWSVNSNNNFSSSSASAV